MKPQVCFDGFTPKGFIFDFDGTLVDSLQVWDYVDEVFLARHNLPDAPEYNEAVIALGFRAGAEFVVDHFDLDMSSEEVIAEWFELAREAYETKVSLKPGVFEYVTGLKKRGCRLSIATSVRRELIELTLARNGVQDCFDGLFLCDELQCRGKFEPTVYLAAAESLGCALSECVVFEDVSIGARTAREAGAYVIGIEDPLRSEWQSELKQAAHKTIASFNDLLIDEGEE